MSARGARAQPSFLWDVVACWPCTTGFVLGGLVAINLAALWRYPKAPVPPPPAPLKRTRSAKALWGRAAGVYATQVWWKDLMAFRSMRAFAATFEQAAARRGEGAGGRRVSRSGHPVHTVVLTGGPCGGKSSSLARLVERMSALGFRCYASPEAATILISSGARPTFGGPGGWSSETLEHFQDGIVSLCTSMEEALVRVALSRDEPSVILLDRGIADGAAYLSDDEYAQLVARHGMTREEVFARYDLVVHLTTAAIGTAAYTTANNEARLETADQAVEVDFKLRNAWSGHPNHVVVDNSTEFEGKVWRVTQQVANLVGLPAGKSCRRRFLLADGVPTEALVPERHVASEVRRTYLKPTKEGTDGSVTHRTQGGQETFVHRLQTAGGEQVEKLMTRREFETARRWHADAAASSVRKQTVTFTAEAEEDGSRHEVYCSLETYLEPPALAGARLLNVGADRKDSSLVLPEGVRGAVLREVTGEASFDEVQITRSKRAVQAVQRARSKNK